MGASISLNNNVVKERTLITYLTRCRKQASMQVRN